MRELGEQSEAEHRKVGGLIGGDVVTKAVVVGQEARHMAEGASARGVQVAHVANSEQAVGAVLSAVGKSDVILVKGSRGVHLERVVNALVDWGRIGKK